MCRQDLDNATCVGDQRRELELFYKPPSQTEPTWGLNEKNDWKPGQNLFENKNNYFKLMVCEAVGVCTRSGVLNVIQKVS